MNFSSVLRVLPIVAIGFLAACASDRASGVPDTGGRDVPDTFPDEEVGRDVGTDAVADADVTDSGGPDTPVTGEPRLEFVSDQNEDLAVNQRTDLEVRYVGADSPRRCPPYRGSSGSGAALRPRGQR